MEQRPQQICHVITFTNLALSRSIQPSAEGMDAGLRTPDENASVIATYIREQEVTFN